MQDTEKMIALLEELLTWAKVSSYKQVKQMLADSLPKPAQRLVYQLTDGTRTGLQISRESRVHNVIVSGLHSAWTKVGLVRKDKGMYRRLFDLEDFGLEVPDGNPKLKAADIKGGKIE